MIFLNKKLHFHTFLVKIYKNITKLKISDLVSQHDFKVITVSLAQTYCDSNNN